ncbi:MAG: sulfite exporter TauE/SafE family protein [Clostridia bacterium]|nr:sulfite exporter TauE/SafE family protein [Clostridia bacterium]MBQ8792593.1 sulfite exporter TauE/SafE family protein [Clostridia bacterium]
MSILAIILNIVFGIISGVFGGLGMGGGTLLIPLLTIFLGFEQKLAQGINLLSFLVMAIFSLIIHFKHGYVCTKGIWPLIVFGVVFSIIGAFLMAYVPTKLLRQLFGGFLCLLSIFQAIKIIKN